MSSAAIARARAESVTRGLEVEFVVSDARNVRRHVDGRFDVVISCDNALPHLLTDDQLEQALRSVRGCLRPSGLLLVSIRDYDSLSRSRPVGEPITVYRHAGLRHGSGQPWQWTTDGDYVDIELFTLNETAPGVWHGHSGTTRYRGAAPRRVGERAHASRLRVGRVADAPPKRLLPARSARHRLRAHSRVPQASAD